MTISRSVFVNILLTTVIITYYFSIGCYGLHLLEPNKAISRSEESTETYGGSVNPPQSPTEGCILPQQPSDGRYTVRGTNGPGIPNEIVQDLTIIQFECFNNFALYPAGKLFLCMDNHWDRSFPRCLRTCPLRASESVVTICELDGIVKNCSERMVEGTKVTMDCKPLYNQLNDVNSVSICTNGSWDSEFIKCAPVVTPQSSTEGCILPQQPSDGKYTIQGANGPGIPNEIVEDLTLIKFECNNNFYLYPPTKYVLCIDNIWLTKLPRCLRTCPPRVSESVITVCDLNGIVKNCSERMVEGTKVSMKCKHFYTQLNDANHISICKNGSWDSGFIKCAPVCGKKIAHGTTLLAGGQMAKKGNFPWHVGIYRKKQTETSTKYKCSGSIISVNVVLSAARCFASNDFGTPYPTDEFYVAAGKYYNTYDEPLDDLAQKKRAKNIIIPLEYAGSATNYQSDIAIVVLQTSFQLTHVVQPVCVDWPNDFEDIQLRSPSNGIVSGWGLTQENGKEVSKELRTLDVAYLSRIDCYGVMPRAFYPFLTQDKFCAGYNNGSSACEGDSGGGLVFYKPEDDRYYIRGLVSDGTCDTKTFGIYTRISTFMKQISEIESVNRNYN